MKGRPVLGAISGFFFGGFLALTLQQFSIRPLDNISFFGLPVLGIVLGLVMAAWAPFGRGKLKVPATAVAGSADPAGESEPEATNVVEPPAPE